MKYSVAAALAACCATAGLAYAQAPSTANEVFVGGTVIMRVQTTVAGRTPAERASSIQARVNRLLSGGPIMLTDITVEPFGGDAVVRVKGTLLFTADADTARFNQSTPMELANTWADHMRRVLPGLTRPTG